MSYPRNAASPPHFLVGYVYQISDGAVQTSGVSARVKTGTGSWGAAAGTLDCDTTSGAWFYTPTQAETNAEAFSVSLYKASCSGVGMTVITGKSPTAGYVAPDWGQVLNPSSTVGLSGTTIKAVTDAVTLPSSASINITGNITGNLSGSVGSVTGAVGSVTGNVGGSVASVTGAVGSVTGNVGGNVTGSVGSVVSGVTVTTNNDKTGYSLAQAFPSNFASLVISSGGVVNANVTQWNGGSLPTIGTSTLTAADVWTYAVSRTLTTTIPTAAAIADAVWDEAYAGHTTAGTFGKLMDILRKANYVTEGTVAAGQTPTTTVFRSGLTAPTGTYDHQTILFLTGTLTGESRPIDTYVQTNGTFTLAEPLTSAPAVGDEFVLLPDHVHPITAIAAGVRTELAAELALIDDPVSSRLATSGYTAPDNAGIAAVKAKTDNLPASPAAVGDIPTAVEVADAVLGRSVATVQATAGEHSLTTVILAALESNTVDSPGNLRIYHTDGTTVYQTRPLTSDANAEPITGIS